MAVLAKWGLKECVMKFSNRGSPAILRHEVRIVFFLQGGGE